MDEHLEEQHVRLLLLANQALFRTSLGRFLSTVDSLDPVIESGNPQEALDLLIPKGINLVLLDFDDNPKMRDEFIQGSRRAGYQGRFLVVTGTVDPRHVIPAIRSGAAGIFLKSEAPDRLIQAISHVMSGGVWLDQTLLRILADPMVERMVLKNPAVGDPLKARELKVLSGILAGLTNRKISQDLGVSEATVKSAVQQLFYRAGVRRRSQLVRAAMEGFFGPLMESSGGGLSQRLAV